MAIVNNFNRDPDDTNNQQSGQQDQQSQAQASAPKQTSGASTYGSSAAPTIKDSTPQNANTSASGTSSGSFQNLQNYVSSNKDFNAGSGGLGGKISSNIQGQNDQIQNNLNDVEQQFNDQSQSNRVTYDPTKSAQALSDPTNSSNITNMNKMLTGQYAGPTALDSDTQANLISKANDLKSKSTLEGTQTGRQALLQQLYGSAGNYNPGMNTLDSAILEGNSGQIAQLEGQQNIGQNLVSNLTNNIQQNSDIANQYKQEATQTNQQATKDYQDSVAKLLAQQQSIADNLNTTQNNAYSSAVNQLIGHHVPSWISSQIGTGPSYGVDQSKYVTETPLNATAYNTLTPSTIAQLNGLLGMSAGSTLLDPTTASTLANFQGVLTNPNQLAQLQAQGNGVGYNTAAYQAAVKSAQNNFNSAYNAMKTGASASEGFNSPSSYMIGSTYGTGNPTKDQAALASDMNKRIATDKSMGIDASSDSLIQSDQQALSKLSSLLNKYGLG